MKITVPLYWGERGDPNRKVIGEAVIDTDTFEMVGTVSDGSVFKSNLASMMPANTKLSLDTELIVLDDEERERRRLDAQIDAIHGPGAAAAIDAAYADGSIFGE